MISLRSCCVDFLIDGTISPVMAERERENGKIMLSTLKINSLNTMHWVGRHNCLIFTFFTLAFVQSGTIAMIPVCTHPVLGFLDITDAAPLRTLLFVGL